MEIVIIILLALVLLVSFIIVSKFSIIDEKLNLIIKENSETFQKTLNLISTEISKNRTENEKAYSNLRLELSNQLNNFGNINSNNIRQISDVLKEQLAIFASQLKNLTGDFNSRLEQLTAKIENNLKQIQENNERKLEEMRNTVDEKLHSTLEKRLNESFALVSSRLEEVHKGLGEMQTLATGVGDLKKVLSNVKNRGVWGEMQVKVLIEQILTPDQYDMNVVVKAGSRENVEFAIKLPGKNEQKEEIVYLPIDSKFPLEDYQNLVSAQENSELQKIEEYKKALENRIKTESSRISTKYINPPVTTDFAVLFLPLESLYAEVLSIPGLYDFVQREQRVVIAGPTTLLAILNSLQMGFKTFAIQKRSSEVWRLLGAIKTDFNKFGDLLEKTQQKLDLASKEIGEAQKQSRKIERKLDNVKSLPIGEETNYLLENE
jgi:DNA recombination protein RmuC